MKALLLVLASILTASLLLADPAIISPQDAVSHVGEQVTITGTVDQYHSSARAQFLDMGGRYPNEVFTVVSFSKAGIPGDELEKLQGKTISITGKVTMYHGKPEIILTSLTQISSKP